MQKVKIIPLLLLFSIIATAQTQKTPPPDLTKQPTLYVVGYAHLDTEWRWEYPLVILFKHSEAAIAAEESLLTEMQRF
jgi:hypothetical protein